MPQLAPITHPLANTLSSADAFHPLFSPSTIDVPDQETFVLCN